MAVQSPKFGIIGCGNIARFHFEGLRKAGAEVVHVVDRREDVADRYVKEFGAKFSTDYRALLRNPEVSVVTILTSSQYHYPMAMEALAAGKDVVCEKTMMDCADEAEAVAKRAAETGQLFFTAYMKRFFPAAIKAKELVPRLGTLFSAQVRAYQQWGNYYDIEPGAAVSTMPLDNYGGAIIKCAGSHMIDMTLYLLGRPASVYAHVDYVPGTAFDRKATALLEYDCGLAVSLEAATHPLKRIGYERNSWDEFIQINGVNGRLELFTVKWDEPENNPALLIHYDNETETTTEHRFGCVNPFDVEMEYMVRCLQDRVQGSPSAVDGFNVDLVIESMVESSKRRAPLTFDWRGL